jgi:hypothetical protein
MNYEDPITKKLIAVKSVYIPSATLLQGRPYTRSNEHLNQYQRSLPLPTPTPDPSVGDKHEDGRV